MVINSIACAYFALSIPLAILNIARSAAKQSRALLIIMDMVNAYNRILMCSGSFNQIRAHFNQNLTNVML